MCGVHIKSTGKAAVRVCDSISNTGMWELYCGLLQWSMQQILSNPLLFAFLHLITLPRSWLVQID